MAEKPSEDTTKLPKVCAQSFPSLDNVPPSPDLWSVTQAQQELDEAKEIFDLLNDQLVREIPILLEQRVPYFDPSFEAMIRMQCKFAEEGYEKLSGVQRYFGDSVRDDYAAGQLDAQVEGVLQEMRELSICGAA
jgi:amphiphysin